MLLYFSEDNLYTGNTLSPACTITRIMGFAPQTFYPTISLFANISSYNQIFGYDVLFKYIDVDKIYFDHAYIPTSKTHIEMQDKNKRKKLIK